jgi:hypothetical protein
MAFVGVLPPKNCAEAREYKLGGAAMTGIIKTLCISPEGFLFAPDMPAFCRHVGYVDADFDLTDYAVRNMGFVLLLIRPDKDASVRCRPRLLTVPCVHRTCRELRQRGIVIVRLNCVQDGTDPAHWPNYRAFLVRLGMSNVREVFGVPASTPATCLRPLLKKARGPVPVPS